MKHQPRNEGFTLLSLAQNELARMHIQRSYLHSDSCVSPTLVILLELYISEAKEQKNQATYLLEAAEIPHATGLRKLKGMQEARLIHSRMEDGDRRSRFIELTDMGRATLEAYLFECKNIGS